MGGTAAEELREDAWRIILSVDQSGIVVVVEQVVSDLRLGASFSAFSARCFGSIAVRISLT